MEREPRESGDETRCIREGYRMLVRLTSELRLGVENEIIEEWYRELAKAVMDNMERYGESVREHYQSISDVREKASFPLLCGVFRVQGKRLDETYLSVTVKVEWSGNRNWSRETTSMEQVWNLDEGTLLPSRQSRRLLCKMKQKKSKNAKEEV